MLVYQRVILAVGHPIYRKITNADSSSQDGCTKPPPGCQVPGANPASLRKAWLLRKLQSIEKKMVPGRGCIKTMEYMGYNGDRIGIECWYNGAYPQVN